MRIIMKTKIIVALLFVMVSVAFAQTYVSGAVSGVWDSTGSPYYVTGESYVPPGESLMVKTGCSVIFQGFYSLVVDTDARFKAIGTLEDSIIFTAEDTVLGWSQLKFFSTAEGCSLSYCKVLYGEVYSDFSSICVMNCRIKNRSPFGIECELDTDTSYIISNSITSLGCGIKCWHSWPLIADNLICNNGEEGILCWYSEPSIENNVITNNSASGIRCNQSDAVIRNNIIENNTGDVGGGISMYYSGPLIESNYIRNNSADRVGGGIYCTGGRLFNNVISGNYAGEDGGAICFDSYTNPVLINNTITDNTSADRGGAFYFIRNERFTFINNVIWGNHASWGNEIYLTYVTGSQCSLFCGNCIIDTANCFKEIGAGGYIWRGSTPYSPPYFSDTLFHLSDSSSCVDGGCEMIITVWNDTIPCPLIDIEGNTRPFAGGCDIGAYESPYNYIDEANTLNPTDISLSTYPNPFNSSVRIFADGGSNFEIFDIDGRCVTELEDKQVWTPDASLGSGVYLVRVKIGEQSVTKRIVYLK